MKFNEINQLEKSIVIGEWKTTENRLFAGADICVCHQMPENPKPNTTYVVSKEATAISSLIFTMKSICANDIDYLSKYRFYGLMADAANRALLANASLKNTLVAMIEAVRVGYYNDDEGLYFAYGSNMSYTQMHERCPEAYPVSTAIIHDYRFDLDEAGVATITSEENSIVYGLLWRITEQNAIRLDEYEGVAFGCYERISVKAEAVFGETDALAYRSLRNRNNGKRRQNYLEGIVDSAQLLNFPQDYIEMLKSHI